MSPSNERSSAAAAIVAEELVITRTFDAPRELVFRVWTEGEHLVHWWGPKGFTMLSAKNDLRDGGTFVYGMRAPDGEGELWGRWVYREVAPPERLAFVNSFADPQGNVIRAPFSSDWPLEVLTTITFTEREGKTTLTMRGIPINATEAEQMKFNELHESMHGGWGGTFDKLAAHLETTQREISTTRVFDAPRELVWEAWTDPKHVSQWWGPNGFTTTTSVMDVRPGGRWIFVMHGPDGTDYPNEITYVEVVKPERLVYEHGPEPLFHVTVKFVEEGRKTRIEMQSLFDTAAERDRVVEEYGAIEGMHQTLGRLAEFLAKKG